MTESKEKGGLGLRRMQELNVAMMAKMGWRIMKDKNTLWTQVMSRKYMKGDACMENFTNK